MRTGGLEHFTEIFESLRADGRWGSAIELCRAFLAEHRNNSEHPGANRVHKLHVDALLEASSFDGAFAAYDLRREDTRPIHLDDSDIICCSTIRNERQRLPFFVDYHRRCGVTRFFFVDNGSSDGSVEWLLSQSDVRVFSSSASFARANFGAAWFELILRRYGVGHWALILDADELFFYPRCEARSLKALCAELDASDLHAYPALLLDMYSDRPISETVAEPGQDFREVCAFFDRAFYHQKAGWRRPLRFWGGVRQRVFGGDRWNYCLSKVPLLKYRPDCVLDGGQHETNYPEERIAAERGAILHFKFVSTFPEYAASEVEREAHAAGAEEYRIYTATLARTRDLSFYDPSRSVRLESSAQLVDLGVMGPEEVPVRTEADDARAYNTLHQFTDVGLLRQVAVDGSKTYFDTNVSQHHHFFVEGENDLLDIPHADVVVGKTPIPPEGYEVARIDVVVRLRKKGR